MLEGTSGFGLVAGPHLKEVLVRSVVSTVLSLPSVDISGIGIEACAAQIELRRTEIRSDASPASSDYRYVHVMMCDVAALPRQA